MKLTILYHPQSDHSRMIETYVHDIERTSRASAELLSLETIEGADTARVYDIVRYPAIIVTRDDGQLMKDWQGDSLPLMSEVLSYL